jgi:hypothetical protein
MMSTKMMVTAGVCAAALIVGAGLAMSGGGKKEAIADAPEMTEPVAFSELEMPEPAVVAAAPKPDCREVATAETGFDPATTPYPVREDAGNKQVLKGAAVGAAVGAVGGELITDRASVGAAVGAGAGALGGHAIKKSKQNAADERYEAQVAAYNRSKAQYDAALATCLAT